MTTPTTSLPRLGYVVQPGSFATFALLDASRELCELVWVANASELEPGELRLLRRTGTVVEIGGLPIGEAVDLLGSAGFDGILSLADDKLRWTAEAAARLGLPFHSPETATSLTDKLDQRRCFRDADLPAPRSWVVSSSDDVTSISHELTFPVVLKPRVGEASRDTVLASSLEELAREVTDGVDGGPPERDFVVEEYIPDATRPLGGEGFAGYVSVESYVEDGDVHHLAITGRFPPAHPFRETGFFIPAAVEDPLADGVRSAAAAAAISVGVTTGCLHTEVKLTDAGPVVIEVNGRIGGGVPEMLAASTGVGFLRIAMRLALGMGAGVPDATPCDRLAYLFYVQAPAAIRKVTRVEGIEAIRALPGVEDVGLRNGPGSFVDWRAGNHGYVASVFGTAQDHDDLRRIHAFVTATIEIDGVG